MSLNYELSGIENWEEIKDNGGTIQCLSFLSMFIGMPIISESGKDGWREFAIRTHMWEDVHGAISSEYPRFPVHVIRRYVGFRTNASRMTNTQFGKQLARQMREAATRAVDAEIESMEAPTPILDEIANMFGDDQ